MEIFFQFLTILIVCSHFKQVKSDAYLVIRENWGKCEPTSPTVIDFTKIEASQANATSFILNGRIELKEPIHSPMIVDIKSSRYSGGVWDPSMLNYYSDDFCEVLAGKTESCYTFFETTFTPEEGCPISSKIIQLWNKTVEVGDISIPKEFYGIYRVTIKISTEVLVKKRTKRKLLACNVIEIEFEDVENIEEIRPEKSISRILRNLSATQLK